MQDQFGIIQNLQMSPIPQTIFLVGTFLMLLTARQLYQLRQYLQSRNHQTLQVYLLYFIPSLQSAPHTTRSGHGPLLSNLLVSETISRKKVGYCHGKVHQKQVTMSLSECSKSQRSFLLKPFQMESPHSRKIRQVGCYDVAKLRLVIRRLFRLVTKDSSALIRVQLSTVYKSGLCYIITPNLS